VGKTYKTCKRLPYKQGGFNAKDIRVVNMNRFKQGLKFWRMKLKDYPTAIRRKYYLMFKLNYVLEMLERRRGSFIKY